MAIRMSELDLDERVELLGADIQAYLVMDGVHLKADTTESLARRLLGDPDWASFPGIDADEIRAAVEKAIDEEFGNTYGGESIAARTIELLTAGESEWEYGVQLGGEWKGPHIFRWSTLKEAEAMAALNPQYSASYFRRRESGRWLPLRGEGENGG